MIIQRRNFLMGLASSLAAPAIVRASSLMLVKALIDPYDPWNALYQHNIFNKLLRNQNYGKLAGYNPKFFIMDENGIRYDT